MTPDHSTAAVAAKLEATFQAIHDERMAVVPIINPVLRVATVGTRRLGDDWLSILVTPWCMNIMLLPGSDRADHWPDWRLGGVLRRRLPTGDFSFICGEETTLGRFQLCSLFSPMLGFVDQEAAIATAEAALVELMTTTDSGQEPVAEPARSRRGLLGLAQRAGEA